MEFEIENFRLKCDFESNYVDFLSYKFFKIKCYVIIFIVIVSLLIV